MYPSRAIKDIDLGQDNVLRIAVLSQPEAAIAGPRLGIVASITVALGLFCGLVMVVIENLIAAKRAGDSDIAVGLAAASVDAAADDRKAA
jgi:hypothetical protein